MRIGLLNSPGRFPTVNHDAGTWWDHVCAQAAHQTENVSANYLWWTHVCVAAAGAISDVRTGAAFATSPVYCSTIAKIDSCLNQVNAEQAEFVVSLSSGPTVHALNYADSASIVQFSRFDSVLLRTIDTALASVETLDLALVRITSPIDLLTATLVVRVLRQKNSALHVCLIDHGYENFSLKAHMLSLEHSDAFGEVFDSIIVEKDHVEHLVPRLINQLARGIDVPRFLRHEVGTSFPTIATVQEKTQVPVAPLPPIFSPTPVLHIRLSASGCYWGRCTYCTQNAKYVGTSARSKSSVTTVVTRLSEFRAAGCRTFILSDEALSPAMLKAFSEEILRHNVDIDWSCRCKLERTFDRELIELCARAGCKEILFGLETTSTALLLLMDKHVPEQTTDDIAEIFRIMGQSGVGIQINLINGFPGEDIDAAWDTVNFVTRALAHHRNATFGLNPFTVFPLTPISEDPSRWGIDELALTGDIPSFYPHHLDVPTRRRTAAVVAAFPELQARLEHALGWNEFTAAPGGRSAFELYMTSGHGVVFKCLPANPVDQQRKLPVLLETKYRPTRRRRAFLTGATGAVGAAVLTELAAQDWETVLMVRDASAAKGLGCSVIEADLYDLPDLADVLAGMDAVIHCASPRSLHRHVALAADVDATGRLLDAWSTGSFVYTSSQTVYGIPNHRLSEQDTVHPDNWYDLAKITNEHQVNFAARNLTGVGISLRLPLVFSSDVRRGAGNYLIELMAALERRDTFVFADQHAMDTHGSVYISDADLGRAIVRAAGLPKSAIYNLDSVVTRFEAKVPNIGFVRQRRMNWRAWHSESRCRATV